MIVKGTMSVNVCATSMAKALTSTHDQQLFAKKFVEDMPAGSVISLISMLTSKLHDRKDIQLDEHLPEKLLLKRITRLGIYPYITRDKIVMDNEMLKFFDVAALKELLINTK